MRLLAVALLAGFIVYSFIRVGTHAYKQMPGDWGVYYRAGDAMRQRLPIYTLEAGPLLTFKNAPVVALAAAPLSMLPRSVARMVSLLVDIVLLTGMMALALRLIDPGQRLVWLHMWIAMGALVFCYPYLFAQLYSGQTTVLFLASTVAGFYLAVHNRPRLAGLALSLGICLKLVPLCFIPYLLFVSRPARAITWTMLCTLALLLIPALWVGWEANALLLVEWPRHLRDTDLPEQVWRLQNQSVFSQLMRLLTDTSYEINFASLAVETVRKIWLTVSLLGAAVLYVFIYFTRHHAGALATHLALLLTYMTLFNPLAWRYNFLALAVPYAVVLAGLFRRPEDRMTLILLVGSCAFVTTPAHSQIYGARFIGASLLVAAVLSVHFYGNAKAQRSPQAI